MRGRMIARLWEVGTVHVDSEQFMSRTRIGTKTWRRDFISQTGEESSSQFLVEDSVRSLSTSGEVTFWKAIKPGKFIWLEFKSGAGASFVDWRIASVLLAKWSRSSSGDWGHSRGDCGDKIEFNAFPSVLPSFSASSICCRRKDERFCWNSFRCFRDYNFRRLRRSVSLDECLSFRSRWWVLRFEAGQSASNHLQSDLWRIVILRRGAWMLRSSSNVWS